MSCLQSLHGIRAQISSILTYGQIVFRINLKSDLGQGTFERSIDNWRIFTKWSQKINKTELIAAITSRAATGPT